MSESPVPPISEELRRQRYERVQRQKNMLDQILEKEYYAWCRQQCADIIKVYTKCREDAGLAMIFKCREEQRAIGECVAPFSKDAARMQAFKDARIAEIVEKGIGAAADPKE